MTSFSLPGSIRRAIRRILVGLAVLVLLLAAATARLIVWPASGMPSHVDAIVMMAGPGDRLSLALKLAREHRASTLVVSTGWEGYGGPCPAAVSGIRLVCFEPDPGNTRGEAEFAGHLARQDHWSSIVLVTITPQDTRARILMRRCYAGSLYVMTAGIPLSSYPYQIAYEWGALFKAEFLQRSC